MYKIDKGYCKEMVWNNFWHFVFMGSYYAYSSKERHRGADLKTVTKNRHIRFNCTLDIPFSQEILKNGPIFVVHVTKC